MNRKNTAFCVAAAFGCIATLGAQTPTSTSSQPNTMRSSAAHDVSVTGCLAKGADGRFVLNNARMDDQMSSSTTSSTTPESTTAGTPASTPASKTSTPAATTWMLGGGSDLDKHLGHKIQVTGKTSWDGSAAPGATAGGTSTTGTPSTAGTTGSTTTSGEHRTTSESDSKSANQPRLDVQSVKMIAASCS